MNHLLQDASATPVGGMRTQGEILIAEHAPHADYFEAFGGVRFDQKVIAHLLYFSTCHRLAKSSVHVSGARAGPSHETALLAIAGLSRNAESDVVKSQ